MLLLLLVTAATAQPLSLGCGGGHGGVSGELWACASTSSTDVNASGGSKVARVAWVAEGLLLGRHVCVGDKDAAEPTAREHDRVRASKDSPVRGSARATSLSPAASGDAGGASSAFDGAGDAVEAMEAVAEEVQDGEETATASLIGCPLDRPVCRLVSHARRLRGPVSRCHKLGWKEEPAAAAATYVAVVRRAMPQMLDMLIVA